MSIGDEPAFPVEQKTVVTVDLARAIDVKPPSTGMTLRQWYAGQALQGVATALALLRADGQKMEEDADLPKFIADAAVQVADALIEKLSG